MNNALTRYLRKKSPVILSCVGIAGVAVTTIFAIRATPKAMRLLEEAEGDSNKELTVVEKIKIAGPVYIPTMLSGLCTIGCIAGVNLLNQKQQVSLMGAYAIVDSSYRKYREKAKELYGTETDIRVLDEMSKDQFKKRPVQITDGDGKLLWYEPYRDEFFEMTEKEVMDAEYNINRNFALRGESNLNEFYSFLGLEPTDAGCEICWDIYDNELLGENSWIDFEHHLVVAEDGTEYYRIEIVFPSRMGIIED